MTSTKKGRMVCSLLIGLKSFEMGKLGNESLIMLLNTLLDTLPGNELYSDTHIELVHTEDTTLEKKFGNQTLQCKYM